VRSESGARVTTQTLVGQRMGAVRQQNTEPELALRAELRRLGVNYRLHDKRLPGTPDIVLSRSRIAVFVHGCFWHRHNGCPRATSPKSNVEFWNAKFKANILRDAQSAKRLRSAGWRVFVVWECDIKADAARPTKRIAAKHRSILAAKPIAARAQLLAPL
jgi:DNA mismatch endonuclease (patch repair protein)